MPNENQGFVMTIKATDGTLVPLYPQTIKDQVVGWNAGEIFGPYQITLSSNNWSNNHQTVNLDGINPEIIPECVKVLSGTEDQIKEQDYAYSLLDPLRGIESLQNKIRFTCVHVPSIDFNVQVYWSI